MGAPRKEPSLTKQPPATEQSRAFSTAPDPGPDLSPDDGHERWRIPSWLRLVGSSSWYAIGIVILIAAFAWFVKTTQAIIIPFIIAGLLAPMLSPLASRLERHGIKRWVGALLGTLLVIVAGVALVFLIVVQAANQAGEIGDQIAKAIGDVADWLDRQGWGGTVVSAVGTAVRENWQTLVKGIVPRVSAGLSSIVTTIVVIVLAINILFFLIKDGRRIGGWLSGHLGVPRAIGARTLAHSAKSIRGYFLGTTVVGIVNACVVGIGALLMDTPLAFVIAVVVLFTNYVPFIGAFIGGAFAVLIAFAGGGPFDALIMLILVLAANGPAQWIVQPFALSATLDLHPIIVIFVTMAGGILAGPLGSVVAAPLTAVVVEAVRQVRSAGLFSEEEAAEPTAEPGEP